MTYLTREQFSEAEVVLNQADVYLERLGGCVVVRELTGRLEMMASRHGVEERITESGAIRVPDLARRRCVQLALALVDGNTKKFLLADTPEEIVTRTEIVENLPWRDQLLLSVVLDAVTDDSLTEGQRAFLREPHSSAEMLERLQVEQVATDTLREEGGQEYAMLLSVALRVPQVLFGQVPMSIIRDLYARIQVERAETADALATAMLGGIGTAPEEGAGGTV